MINAEDLNFIFWGTPDVAKDTLDILKQSGYLPSLIVTSPDKPKGRGLEMTESPVAIFAQENDIPCLKPETLDEEFIKKLKAEEFDLSIVVAYGKIMPEKIINAPKLGSINIHYSLLPKYRGASPVESAILNGDKETGVSIQQMEYKMDAGAVLATKVTEIGQDEQSPELRQRLIKIGGELLIENLSNIIDQKITPQPQDETLATYCKKIKKEDGLLDLSMDGIINYNKYRAYAHWPRVFFFFGDKRVIVTKAHLEQGAFVIEKIIKEGGKETDYKPNI